jgi:glycerate-2-kinase
LLATLYAAAIASVDPVQVAKQALRVSHGRLVVRGWRGDRVTLPLACGVLVVGAGKASAGLAAGVEAVLGSRIVGGIVIVPDGYARPLRHVEVAIGDHPVPYRRSAAATRGLLAALARHPEAAVLVLLTGGASSLLAAPAPGLRLADERRAGAWLLASGADITAVNVVRKHLSAIKGGRLAERLAGRPAAALVISDVPGDDVAVVGSGPTVADPSTFADALAITRAFERTRPLPASIQRHLERGARGAIVDTPKPGTPAARACPTLLVAANATARAGAAHAARRAGIATVVSVSRPVVGDVEAAARAIARRITCCRRRLRQGQRALLIAGGETTVQLGRRPGCGGRNQELAVAVARALAGEPGWVLLAAGSDGVDGPTDAAGAFADGSTAARAVRAGSFLADAVRRHDVYPALAKLGDLFAPGPTGTNVSDLMFALVWKDCGWRLPARVIKPSGRR